MICATLSQKQLNKKTTVDKCWRTVCLRQVDSPGHLQLAVGKQRAPWTRSALAAPCRTSARVPSNLEPAGWVRVRGRHCPQEAGGCRGPACRADLFPGRCLPKAQRWEGAPLMTWCPLWLHPGTAGPRCPLQVSETRREWRRMTGGGIFNTQVARQWWKRTNNVVSAEASLWV